jgi:60 kDa SS-A/Ro ribonucleoprotein
MAASYGISFGVDGIIADGVRRFALLNLDKVARTGTHLFHFAEYVESFRGWGRGLRNAISRWYTTKKATELAYQLVKYRRRDGWSHRDLLRLSHAYCNSRTHRALFDYTTHGKVDTDELDGSIVLGVEGAKCAGSPKEIVNLIQEYGLTREMIPTEYLNNQDVWAALLDNMPMTAMIRNLGKMSAVGLLQNNLDYYTRVITERLGDAEYIRRSRVHPLQVLTALRVYRDGEGMLGKLQWYPVAAIIDALDDAFYCSFENVNPTGKRALLALDVSDSMAWSQISGMPITPREAAAAMAMVTARREKSHHIVGFQSDIVPINISPKQRLDDVTRAIADLPFGVTNCAAAIHYALKNSLEIDAFVIYTDNETWSGSNHASQALDQYRQQTGIPAKMVVVGMTATDCSIADPNDPGMLDVAGFDTSTPQLISEFISD